MSSQFTVCSYNVGVGMGDYQALCRHLGQAPKFVGNDAEVKEQLAAFTARYNAVQETTANRLKHLADVFCLQEVGNTERPFMNVLNPRYEHFPQDFHTIRFEGLNEFDTAVLLSTNRFKDITNHSINVEIARNFSKDVAIAAATDRETGERVTFVSAHPPGFDFTSRNLNAADTREGDIYCRAIAQKLSEIGNSSIEIIGSDMNANPERWNPRFEIFSEFQVNRNRTPTNVNPRDEAYQEREIDFVLTKIIFSIWQQIKALFCSHVQNTASIADQRPLGWNAETNCSDHLPVFIRVTSTPQDSKIYQLYSDIMSFLCQCLETYVLPSKQKEHHGS